MSERDAAATGQLRPPVGTGVKDSWPLDPPGERYSRCFKAAYFGASLPRFRALNSAFISASTAALHFTSSLRLRDMVDEKIGIHGLSGGLRKGTVASRDRSTLLKNFFNATESPRLCSFREAVDVMVKYTDARLVHNSFGHGDRSSDRSLDASKSPVYLVMMTDCVIDCTIN
eukprot:scaffold1495_cov248-Pinguiococcus_pyrenoidosus.AAC.12